jgi:hypothetical protein
MTQQTAAQLRATDRPVRDRRWLRWGAIVLAADLVVHNTGGVLANDWEGWGNFWGNFTFVLVTGVMFVGPTYGVLARWALRPSAPGNRPAGAALGAGIASLAAWALYFTWAPVLIAPAALLLGGEGLRRARTRRERRSARAGSVLGAISVAVFLTLWGYAWLNGGDLPFGL